jgi:hypothetical protein
MARYTCFFLDQDIHLFARHQFDANTDEEAIAEARAFCAAQKDTLPRSFELWVAAQLVRKEHWQPRPRPR